MQQLTRLLQSLFRLPSYRSRSAIICQASQLHQHCRLLHYSHCLSRVVATSSAGAAASFPARRPDVPATATASGSDTRMYVWGLAKPFFIGREQKRDTLTPTLFPSPSPSSPLVDLSIGAHHFALLTADGSVYTGGQGQRGELGWRGKAEQGLKRVDLTLCVSVTCGLYHTAALTSSGEVYVWGYGGSLFSPNALGIGAKRSCRTPTLVTALQSTPVRQIAAGREHCLALTHTGEVWAWGKGDYGRLGLGGNWNQLTPQRLDALTEESLHVVHIACGEVSGAATVSHGGLFTWGRNALNHLGLQGLVQDWGNWDSRQIEVWPVPERVKFGPVSATGRHLFHDIAIAQCAVGYQHMIARSTEGRVYQFGAVKMLSTLHWPVPTLVTGSDDAFSRRRIIDVAAGRHFSAAVDDEGVVWTWGSGRSGCLGHGSKSHVREPRPVRGFGEGQELGRAMRVLCAQDNIAVLAHTTAASGSLAP